MFTIGIFTTHIPYLAFAFFYVFFFLAGYQKISEEKTGTAEKPARHKLTLVVDNQIVSDNGNFDFDEFNLYIAPKPGRIFYLNRTKKIPIPLNEQIQPGYLGFFNFSRPPPAT